MNKKQKEKIRKKIRELENEPKRQEDVLYDNFSASFEEFFQYVENNLNMPEVAREMDRLVSGVVTIYHKKIKK